MYIKGKMLKFVAVCIAVSSCVCAESEKSSKILGPNFSYDTYDNRRDDTVTKFLEEYRSSGPVMILVDNVQESHRDAWNFVEHLEKLNANFNLMLMKFNTSGVTSLLETTYGNRKKFENLLLEKIPEEPSSFIGQENLNKTAVFYGILNAAQILPNESAIVVFIRRGIVDESLGQVAVTTCRKKRIRVYVVWGGKDPSFNNAEIFLKEISRFTGGLFLANSIRNLAEDNYEDFIYNTDIFTNGAIILSARDLTDENTLEFPIDSDVTNIHIIVSPNMTTGIITTPRGRIINVNDEDSVVKYSKGSFSKRRSDLHEIHLNTTVVGTQDVGIWRIQIKSDVSAYNVTIFAHSKLITHAYFAAKKYPKDGSGKGGSRDKIIKLGVTGDVRQINTINLVNTRGHPILSNINFTLDQTWNKKFENIEENIETLSKELSMDIPKFPNESFYVEVNGIDGRGKKFTRLNYVRRNSINTMFQLPPLTVDVGLGSELIAQPNRQPQLFFEVTNNGNKAVLVRFYCSDEKSILFSMSPWYKWISPQETATVRVTLTTRAGSYQDLVTFTAQGPDVVEKRTIVDVGTSLGREQNDHDEPDLEYQFTSDCTDVLLRDCHDGTWTIEARAKDTGSGLLQLTSIPKGMYFPDGFTTGSRDEITGYYSDSCCNPDLQLIAVDRQNNRRTRNANAYRAIWSAGAIAAIILGIILLLLLIVAIVFIIKRCCGTKENYDLPTYRGPTTSRT